MVKSDPIADTADRQLYGNEPRKSATSIWEITIKSRLRKIGADAAALANAIKESGFQELPVNSTQPAAVATLLLHCTDPFDRRLLAQAFLEPLRLV